MDLYFVAAAFFCIDCWSIVGDHYRFEIKFWTEATRLFHLSTGTKRLPIVYITCQSTILIISKRNNFIDNKFNDSHRISIIGNQQKQYYLTCNLYLTFNIHFYTHNKIISYLPSLLYVENLDDFISN